MLRLENITQYVDERIGQVLQSLKGLESLINLNSSLAPDLGLNLLSVLFLLTIIFQHIEKTFLDAPHEVVQ